MGDLRVDYTSLRDKLDRLCLIVTAINEEIAGIAEYTADLDIFWDGDANSAFIAGIGEDLLDIDAIMMRIRGTVRAAVKVLDIYQKNEKEIKRMIGDFRI